MRTHCHSLFIAITIFFVGVLTGCSVPISNNDTDQQPPLRQFSAATAVINMDLSSGCLMISEFSDISSSWNVSIVDYNLQSNVVKDPDSDFIYYAREGEGIIKTTLANTRNYTVISSEQPDSIALDTKNDLLYCFVDNYQGTDDAIFKIDFNGANEEFVTVLPVSVNVSNDVNMKYDELNNAIIYIDSNQSFNAIFWKIDLATNAKTKVDERTNTFINDYYIVNGDVYYVVIEGSVGSQSSHVEKWNVANGSMSTIMETSAVSNIDPSATFWDAVTQRLYYYHTYYDDGNGDRYIGSVDANGNDFTVHCTDWPEFTHYFGDQNQYSYTSNRYWATGAQVIR